MYEASISEKEYLESFQESLSTAVAGYIATRLGDQVNGVPAYIGEEVSDQEIEEVVETAPDVLTFSGARIGQLAYAAQELRSENRFKNYEVGGRDVKASELTEIFNRQIQNFEESEEVVEYNLEVAQQQEDVPADDIDLEATREIPDFDIEDWQWPRENLWPF